MEWVEKLLKLAINLFSSNCEGKPRPYKVDKRWIEVEREAVNEALKRKHRPDDE
jgi:hypothetical protein